MEKFREKFVEEANDLINELEKVLLELESQPNNAELIQQIFRVMHSLKGGSAMFGFNKMDKFTHHLENIYDLIRTNKLAINNDILNITLASVDHLRSLIQEKDDSENTNRVQHDLLLSKILEIINENVMGEENAKTMQPMTPRNKKEHATYYISFKPHPNIFNFGTNPLYLIDELVDLGQAMVFPRFDKLPGIDILEPANCYLYWDIFLATNQGINAISEVFIFADEQCDLTVKKISELNLIEENSFIGIIEKAVQNKQEINIDELVSLTNDLEKIYEKEKETQLQAKITTTADTNISSIRVSSEKLDNLINWVSELVTIQARLSLFAQETETNGLLAISEEVEKISRRLRDDVFSIRLIPIENMLTRFHRLVRELSQNLDKDVVFKTEGTDTELDKNIIEMLSDPLMHIVRNSMDHGIESKADRKKMGKPAKATILLKAFYSGTNVIIQISDDGKGIDPEQIKKHALSKGLIAADVEISKKETLELVFLPGFSTAKQVTKVSGRGVGMDVVKRKIAEIRGEVDLDSEINKGTTITIRLPLTLSIIDGLLVQIGETKFVIPLSSVDKVYEFKHEALLNAVNHLIRTDNNEVAYLNLRKLFEIDGTPPETEHVIVVQYSDVRIGLSVDNIIGQYQAVLKPLGKMYKNQQSISGATILGDGTVALVLDTNKLITQFANSEIKVGG
ncbi:MAG: chemotaxis protein CheA [Bacteroidetes bacterium HGW-Bacteroidetes-4]|jgi:two-component system chemotaxis sensor kinase CheA|nr:MAG: chemotaxis protein CheA [Bacteroidetes bacterium HGW-Bacteroidetes-4]